MKYTFFWDGPFSQWSYSDFIIDGVKYNTAEQYMMSRKANLFGDYTTLGKIMKAKTPKDQKALGREVKGFDVELWNKWCRKFVYDGNLAKFSQNPRLEQELEDTIGTKMVEASPYDKVWGIGIGPNDPKRLDPKNWNGTNYLGDVLTVVRAMMFGDDLDQPFLTELLITNNIWWISSE